MKIAIIIVRSLLGLLFLFASISYFFKLAPAPELTGAMKTYFEGLVASGYVLTVVKSIELLCGLLFISGRLVPLATVVIFPIVVNIVLTHAFLAPEGLPVALFVLVADLFLAYVNRSHYKGLFTN